MPERSESRELLDAMLEEQRRMEEGEAIPLVREKETKRAMAEILAIEPLREKPTLSPEEMAALEKAVDGMLAFVESRTDAMREAEKDLETLAASDRLREEAAVEAKKFASLRAEAEELHQLAQAADTLRALTLAQAVEGRRAFNEGTELGMRIAAARDAIRSFQEMRGAVVGLLLRSDQQQIIDRCGELVARLDADIAHEQRVMAIAGKKQAQRIDLAGEKIMEEFEARQAGVSAAEYPPAEELVETREISTVSLDTVVEDIEDLYAGLEAEDLDAETGQRVVAHMESTVELLEGQTARAERAIADADWQEAALASKDLHEFGQIVGDAIKAHYDGLEARRADASGLDYAVLRIQAADDAERVLGGMLDLAVERMARASAGEKEQWTETVDRLRRAMETERASRKNAEDLIELLRASAAE